VSSHARQIEAKKVCASTINVEMSQERRTLGKSHAEHETNNATLKSERLTVSRTPKEMPNALR